MKGIFKKGVCLALSAAMMATMASTTFASGQNKEVPIPISNLEELKNFRERVKGGATDLDAYLIRDIDMSSEPNWDPIGSSDNNSSYRGKFNGNGYTITNLRIIDPVYTLSQKGFFGEISEGAEISNLNIDGAQVLCNACQAGVLVGSVTRGRDSTNRSRIYKCNVSDSIINNRVVAQGSSTAGIAGFAKGCDFMKCSVEGSDVEGYRDVANIAGKGTGCNFNLCFVGDGTVEGARGKTAGIAGDFLNTNVDCCFNSSKVKGGNEIAGIVSTLNKRGSGISFANIINCFNIGALEFDQQTKKAGGITAECDGIIINCQNNGDFNTRETNDSTIVGGIISERKQETPCTLRNTYNVGKMRHATNGAIVGTGSIENMQTNYFLNTSSSNPGGGISKTYAEFTRPANDPNSVTHLLNQGRLSEPDLIEWVIRPEVYDYPVLDLTSVL